MKRKLLFLTACLALLAALRAPAFAVEQGSAGITFKRPSTFTEGGTNIPDSDRRPGAAADELARAPRKRPDTDDVAWIYAPDPKENRGPLPATGSHRMGTLVLLLGAGMVAVSVTEKRERPLRVHASR